MYTVDASVHVSALNPAEAGSATSQAFLVVAHQNRLPFYCPTLLPVEVAAPVARVLDDDERAAALGATSRDWPGQTLVPLDEAVAERAVGLAAPAHLRGADAVYAAVAQQYGTTLVTFDREQLTQLPPAVRAIRPADALRRILTRFQAPTEDQPQCGHG